MKNEKLNEEFLLSYLPQRGKGDRGAVDEDAK